MEAAQLEATHGHWVVSRQEKENLAVGVVKRDVLLTRLLV